MIRFEGKKDPEMRAAVERGEPVTFPTVARTIQFEPYRKTALAYAARIDEPFEVDTLEGLHEGKAGDYLAVGVSGEMYPIDADVMERSYERVEW